MKKQLFALTLLIMSVFVFASCDEEVDLCPQVAEEYFELQDAYDAYVAEYNALSAQERQQTSLVTWLANDPQRRSLNLAEFKAENAAICPYLNRPERMEQYRR